jgi:alpha-tubulin suppressor-like RCC1 family protein
MIVFAVAVMDDVISIAAGSDHMCGLVGGSISRIKYLGDNSLGEIGQGYAVENVGISPGDDLTYVNLGTGRTMLSVSAGGGFTCAVLDNQQAKCFGYNGFGQLGQGSSVTSIGTGANDMGNNLTNSNLGLGVTVSNVTCGASHACALLTNATIKCWGSNFFGQLGLGTTNQIIGLVSTDMGSNLTIMSLGASAINVFAGSYHTCALLSSAPPSNMKCWAHMCL